MTVLAGDPTALQHKVDDFAEATVALADAIAQLESIVVGGQARSLEAVGTAIADTTTRMDAALTRYQSTTGALRTYTVALAAAHARAGDAVAAGEAALARRDDEDARADAFARAARSLEEQGQDPRLVQDREEAARYHRGLAEAAFADYQDALGALATARSDVETAAQAAIAAIVVGFDGTSDGVRDHVAAFGRWLSDGWEGFSTWVGEVFAEVVDAVREVVAAIVDALSLVVLACAIPVLIVVVLSLALSPVGIAMIVDVLLGGDFTLSIEILMGVLLAIPAVALFVQMRILTDVIAPDPEVTRFMPSDGDPGIDRVQVGAYDALRDRVPRTSDDLIADMTRVDDAGGPELGDTIGVVSVRSVVGPDGVERWVVTLPSTQDWGMPTDGGATNDLDGNLALFLGDPALRTQYERAVDQALAAAGVSKEDPILFTGFSQGGIMAAHYAAYRTDDYNIQGILTAGSPVDGFPIADDIAVVQVQHPHDPVHQLDGVYGDGGIEAPNRVRVIGGGQHGIDTAHGSALYAQTLEGAPERDTVDRLLADFLIDEDEAASGGYRTASVQYAWSE